MREWFCDKDEIINMTRAWDKEKIWVPDGNRTHDLSNTGRALYALSYESLWRARPFNWVHVRHLSYILLGSTTSKSSWINGIWNDGQFMSRSFYHIYHRAKYSPSFIIYPRRLWHAKLTPSSTRSSADGFIMIVHESWMFTFQGLAYVSSQNRVVV